jgi:hypothetical protein
VFLKIKPKKILIPVINPIYLNKLALPDKIIKKNKHIRWIELRKIIIIKKYLLKKTQ